MSCLAVSIFWTRVVPESFCFVVVKKKQGDVNPNLILTYLRVIKFELEKFILPKNLGRCVQTSTYYRKTKIVF
jgi:hypothetical protein